MTRHFIVLGMLMAALTAATTAHAQKLPALAVEKYTLPNGLHVILHEDHTIPTVTVNIWYHVGSKNEKRGRTGFAHLFEHMMFEGSEHHPADHHEPLEKIGGRSNASTSEDRTNYFETVPSNYLELALWLEADRMGFLTPAMTQEKLDIQRDVVKNERRQRLDNQPYAKVYELALTALYPQEHPYSWSVIGSMEDLSQASLDDVKDFFQTYYRPNNASLVVAGDFDPAEVKRLIEKYFAPLPPGPAIDRLAEWVPKLDGAKRIVTEDQVSLPRYYCIWHTPPQFKPGDAEADLLANALGAGKTSRLYKELVYDKRIAQDVSVYQASNEIASTFNIEVTAAPGRTLEEVEAAVDAAMQTLRTGGITPVELKQAQTGYEAGFVRSLQQTSSRADRLNQYNVFLGEPDKFQWDLDRYLKATTADVQRFVKDWLDPERRLVIHVRPQGDPQPSGSEFDRTTMPGAAAEPAFEPPAIQRATLSNGLKLMLVEKHSLPLVQINLVVKNGWAADPQDKPATASLTSELLDEGTKSRTALQISEEAKAIGASLGSNSSFDASFARLNVLKKELDAGLDLLADIVLNPTFPAEELERQRQIYLGKIQQESRVPVTVAVKAYYRLLYGAGHPYAQPHTGSGTEQSINAITRDDLVNFYRTHYVPNNAALVVVGDLTLAEATGKLEKAFKNWKSGTVPAVTIEDPAYPVGVKICVIDKPNAPQSAIICGHPGIRRADPDYLVCDVMNNTLGGKFGSRINMNLREEKGYTYGASSFFVGRRGVGPFIAYAMVQTEFTDESIVEIIKELRDIKTTRPLTTAELEDSRSNMIKSYPAEFETYSELAGALQQLVVYDLPDDEWRTYIDRVAAVTGEAATRAAQEHLKPEQLLIVVVGDKQKIETDIRARNIGEVEIVNPAQL